MLFCVCDGWLKCNLITSNYIDVVIFDTEPITDNGNRKRDK